MEQNILVNEDSQKAEDLQGQDNVDYINNKLFKKPNQAKYIQKRAENYELLAKNLLFIYFSAYQWGAKFDKETNSLYIMNLICPENIPIFKLKGVPNFYEFTRLVLAAGKKILVEQDMDRIISDEEYAEKMKNAKSVADKYMK